MLYRFQILLKEDKYMKRKLIVPKADGGITSCAKGGEWEQKICQNPNVPIPEGFHHLLGTKAEGFVIQDEFGSEFTYIPVSELVANGTLDGRNFNQKFGRRAFRGETFSKEAFYEKRNPALERSCEKYGGFYLSRFPISYEKGRLVSKKGQYAHCGCQFL